MNTKKTIIFTSVVVLALGLAYFYSRDGRKPTSESQKVTIAQFGDLLLYMPLYIAHHEGIFARHGLNVEIVSTGGDDKTFAAVLSGSAQFGLADPTFVAVAKERGQEGKVIALLIDGVPNYGVSLNDSAPLIRAPSDLSGKTIATVPAPSTSYALVKKLFESAGLPPRIHQVAPPGLVPSLEAKEADYALLIEPWVSQVVSSGGRVAFSLSDYYRHFALTGLTTSPAVLSKDRELTFRILAALSESVEIFYRDDVATLRAAKTRFPGESDGILKQGINRMREEHIYPRCLAMTDEAWKPAVELRREIGDLEREPGPFFQYMDNTFANRACSSTANK